MPKATTAAFGPQCERPARGDASVHFWLGHVRHGCGAWVWLRAGRTLAIRGALGLAQAWAPLREVWMRRSSIFVLPALGLALAGCGAADPPSQAARSATSSH